MGYIRAEEILPAELVKIIQQYVEGETIYIPQKEGARRKWGEKTSVRQELQARDVSIYSDYRAGHKAAWLAEKYYLSEKSIQRIIRKMKNAA